MRAVRPWLLVSALSLSLLAPACKSDDHFTDAAVGDGGGADGASGLAIVEFPTTVELGLVDCGASLASSFDVENTGGADFVYDLSSSNPAFAITPSSGTIIAGTTTTFTVTAAIGADAVAGAALAGELTLLSGEGVAPVAIAVSATPRGGTITLTAGGASFGDVELGLSGTADVVVHNTGNAPVDVAIAAPDHGDYAVAFAGGELAAAATSTATVTYTPGALGTTTATAAITVTGVTCGAVPATLELGGTGTPDGGVLVNGTAAFGDVSCGAGADTRTLTVFNDGNIPATWSASYLTDAESDGARYQLSATSGTVAAGETAEITLTRRAIAVPATPRAYDVTLRITTVGQLTQTHDVAVSQTLRGPVVSLHAPSLDFGFAPVGQTLTTTVTSSNSGNRGGTATFTASGAGFTAPATGAGFGSGGPTFTVSYAPTALGTRTGSVAIAIPGACNAPLTLPLAAGDGPWASVGSNTDLRRTCGFNNENADRYFHNPGTQTLTVSGCTDVSGTDINPVFSPASINVGSGNGSAGFDITWENPSPQRSSTTVATIRCNTNEKHYTTREFTVTRIISGMDLVLEPETDFAFPCEATPSFHERRLRITNNGNRVGTVTASMTLPPPLYRVGSGGFQLAPGASSTAVGVGMGSNSCAAGGTGTISISRGSGSYVCSVTPATIPVTTTP